MKQFLVVSDNHGQTKELTQLAAKYRAQTEVMVHCGDSLLPQDSELMQQFVAVTGNCDAPQTYPALQVVQVGDVRVLVTHGHLYGVNFGLEHLVAVAHEHHAQIVCFGHTHQLGVERRGDVVLINPGSLNYPRGQYASLGGTAALVQLDKNQVTVQYVDQAGQPVADLVAHLRLPQR